VITRILKFRDLPTFEIALTAVDTHYINFEVREIRGESDGHLLYGDDFSIERGDTFVEGNLKWDGCMNLNGFDYCWHLCGREEVAKITHLLNELFLLGPELIAAWDGDE